MLEYIEAFLDLGQKAEDPSALYHCLVILKTTESYMTETQWKIYQLLQEQYDVKKKEARKGKYR